LYAQALQRARHALSLKRVIGEEQAHLADMAARLEAERELETATSLIDRLVDLQLIERHEDPSDRRQVVITTTTQAESIVERFRELNGRRMREMLARVDATDLSVIERALHILTDAIDRPADPAMTSEGDLS
jgi:DNA-binding MarR family transcriptional regulator